MFGNFLIFTGAALGIAALVIFLRLFFTRQRMANYKHFLSEETLTFNPFAETRGIGRANRDKHTKRDGTLTIDPLKSSWVPTAHSHIPVSSKQPAGLSHVQGAVHEPIALGGLDVSPLRGRYELLKEIHEGAMSRVFLARKVKVDNYWIVKFIASHVSELSNEEFILKHLNHTNLPRIIDILPTTGGVFLVESYIEGKSLSALLSESHINFPQHLLRDWMEQFCQVLGYLHTLSPSPIIHCDLKPSNIMISRDNKLVLIDFGISRLHKFGEYGKGYAGITKNYAAPEQLALVKDRMRVFILDRFGAIPPSNWSIDQRTDIFSMGAIFFELAVKLSPKFDNLHLLNRYVTDDFGAIIKRCLNFEPSMRYRNTDEIINDLSALKTKRGTFERALLLRQIAYIAAIILVILSGVTIGGGQYLNTLEAQTILLIEPDILRMSVNERMEFNVTSQLPNNEVREIDFDEIDWVSTGQSNKVASIRGNTIVGQNQGMSVLSGRYRKSTVEMRVDVVPQMLDINDNLIRVAQAYNNGNTVSIFAGSGISGEQDGDLQSCAFRSPGSIDMDSEGNIYVLDDGKIRVILTNGRTETIIFDRPEMRIKMLRVYDSSIYALTLPQPDDDPIANSGNSFMLVKIERSGRTMPIIKRDAVETPILDFDISDDGILFFIDSIMLRDRFLEAIDLRNLSPSTDQNDANAPMLVHFSGTLLASSCAVEGDRVYIADYEHGTIQFYDATTGQIHNVAGFGQDSKNFIDGKTPMFYAPLQIQIADNILYILDYNVLRRINLDGNSSGAAETVAGVVNNERHPITVNGGAESVKFSYNENMDFVYDAQNHRLLLTDPDNYVVREIIVSKIG
ncbi:MAG: protein kinase [Clostridiales bacterium]|jgi:serine/threonine protein kinase/outer membrane protein assembly factor BamB|nr:protein kinase [Clostridiales bacterium]